MLREEAIRELEDAKDGYAEYLSIDAIDIAIEALKQPEIITCGVCRHNGTRNCLLNLWATIFNSKPKDDFYCGIAKRRTDGENLSE